MSLQLFKIPAANLDWSMIVTDEDTGLFCAHGSYGTFAYVWPPQHRGEPLHKFLAHLDFDYFMGKTRGLAAKELDPEKSAKHIRDYIIESRKDGCLSKDDARDAIDDLDRIVRDSSDWEFAQHIHESDALTDALGSDWYEFLCQRHTAECVHFWRVIYPEFLKAINPSAEIAA